MQTILATLFGSDDLADSFVDLADDDDLQANLIRAAFPYEVPIMQAAIGIVFNQIADDDPSAVRAAAQRMLDDDVDPDRVRRQLGLAMLNVLDDLLDPDAQTRFDEDAYTDSLDHLPLPDADEVSTAIVAAVDEAGELTFEEMDDRAIERLGGEDPHGLLRSYVERVQDHLFDRHDLLLLLAGDRVISSRAVSRHMVLTHTLTEHEVETDQLRIDDDLAGFAWITEPAVEDVDAIDQHDENARLVWEMPTGWLGRVGAGTTIAVRLDDEDVVRMTPTDLVEPDPEMVQELIAAYRTESAETGLPEDCQELLAHIAIARPELLRSPGAPFLDVIAAADMTARAGLVAHDHTVWREDRRRQLIHDLMDLTDDREVIGLVMGVVGHIDDLSDGRHVGADEVMRMFRVLGDPEILRYIVPAVTSSDQTADGAPRIGDRLLAVAERRPQRAVASYVAAVDADKRGEPKAARDLARQAVDGDPRLMEAVMLLAGLTSDAGDAPAAARLYRQLPSGFSRDMAAFLQELSAPVVRSISRNQPCWCGSGKKYKKCHLGVSEELPLPDRATWLYRKPLLHTHLQPEPPMGLFEIISDLVGDMPPDDGVVADMMADPIINDVLLVEGGGFADWLARRRDILPADEQLLADAWLLVDRSVHEVDELDADTVRLRDLRSGERAEVPADDERWTDAAVGDLLCCRVLPVGDGHRVLGPVVAVPPGRERALLDVLDSGDPSSVAAWLRGMSGPPRLSNREGEPLLAIELTYGFADADSLREQLHMLFEQGEGADEWLEKHTLDSGERILRTRLELAGDTLIVHTNSEPRAERVSRKLEEVDGLERLADERRPLDGPDDLAALASMAPSTGALGDDEELPADLLTQVQVQMEERWLTEPVPALGGLTPLEAVADPTRRAEVERLLSHFERMPTPEGAMTFRLDVLRARLGL